MPFGVGLDREPCLLDRLRRLIGLRPVALQMVGGNIETAPREQPQQFVIKRRRLERRAQPFSRLRVVLVDDHHILALVRSEEHTSELQSLMRISYAVFCLKKKKHMLIASTT